MDEHNRNTLYAVGLIIAVILLIALLTSGEPEGFRRSPMDLTLHVDKDRLEQVEHDIQRGIDAAERAAEIDREVHADTDKILSRMAELFE